MSINGAIFMSKIQIILKSMALSLLLLLPLQAKATDSMPIQILNNTSDLSIVFGDGTALGQTRMTFGDYSGQKMMYDYGEGLIKSIFGDFSNVVSSGSGSTVKESTRNDIYKAFQNSTKSNTDKPELVAGIFYGQAYIIKILQMAMLKLTTLILWVYGVVFFFASLWGLMKVGGDEKSVLGHVGRQSVPYKLLFGLILIFPTTSGYTVGQLLHTQLNLAANYGGRYIYLSAINLLSSDYIKSGTKTIVKNKLMQVYNSNAMMKDLIRAEYCMREMNLKAKNEYTTQKSSDSTIGKLSGEDLGKLFFGKTIILRNNELIVNYGPTPTDYKFKVINLLDVEQTESEDVKTYQATSARFGLPVDYCGSITVPFDAEGAKEGEKVTINAVKLNNSVAASHLYSMLAATDIAYELWKENESKIGNLGVEVYTKLAQTYTDMEETYMNKMRQLVSGKPLSSIGSSTDDGGWFSRDSGTVANNAIQEYISDNISKTDTAQATFLKHNLELSLEMSKVQKDKKELNDKIDGYANEVVNLLYGNSLSPYNKIIAYGYNYGWIDAGAWFTTLSKVSIGDKMVYPLSPTVSRANLAFDRIDGDVTRNQQKSTYQAISLDIAKYNNLSMYLDPATFEASSVNNMANNIMGLQYKKLVSKDVGSGERDKFVDPFRFEDTNTGIFLARQIGYDPKDPYTHPLMKLKESGEWMQQIGTWLLVGSGVTSFTLEDKSAGGQSQLKGGQEPILQKFFTSALGKMASLGMILAFAFIIGGFFLSTYLPMLPTIYWVMGVMAWAVGMMLNFLAIPIVGLVLAFSSSEDFAGRTINFFMALIDNTLRPLIMPIALFITIVFQALFVVLGSRLISQSYMITDSGTLSLGVLFFVIMYVIVNYIILTSNAALIRVIPEEISKRINGISAAQDEGDQSVQKLSGGLQQSRGEATQSMATLFRAGAFR